ncbi:MAG: nuclear transport factor 2 family protein, partial [Vicinamibacterales bacterium]
TRQWAAMDSRAEPIDFSIQENGTVHAEVHLIAHDLSGHVLFDTRARHVFEIVDGLIRWFDIR